MPDKPSPPLPPVFTLPHWIDPHDADSVRAFMESSAAAWRDCVRLRRENGCCVDCGAPLTLRTTAAPDICPDPECPSHGPRELDTDVRR